MTFINLFKFKRMIEKKISQLELDFVYNFNKNKVTFDNVKIDKKSNDKIDEFINLHNKNNVRFNNKINFKNFVNNFLVITLDKSFFSDQQFCYSLFH